jgi:hypothetical protein
MFTERVLTDEVMGTAQYPKTSSHREIHVLLPRLYDLSTTVGKRWKWPDRLSSVYDGKTASIRVVESDQWRAAHRKEPTSFRASFPDIHFWGSA